MAQYYAVERSPDYLAHYGIKGMHWGVRKAIEKGNDKALARHYRRAVNKAQKLNRRADISMQKSDAKDQFTLGATGLLSGALVAGSSLGYRALNRKLNSRTIAAGRIGLIPFAYDSETGPRVAVPAGALLGGLGAYEVGKGIAAKYRTTQKGHAKATAKASNFRKEMKKAFRGTKYAKLPGSKKKADYY